MQQAIDIGFVDVMLKPVDNDRLIMLLDQVEIRLAGNEPEPLPTASQSTSEAQSSEKTGKTNWWEALEELKEKIQDNSEKFDSQLQQL